jgi:hypothetical protein
VVAGGDRAWRRIVCHRYRGRHRGSLCENIGRSAFARATISSLEAIDPMPADSPPPAAAATYDSGYKLLFSHAQVVEDLLRGFVAEDWVAELDFATLEKVAASYVSDDLREREDDIVWRLRATVATGSMCTCCSSSRAASIRGWPCASWSIPDCCIRI